MSMRRVLKRVSRRIYKDNVSGMKSGCRSYRKKTVKAREPKSQGQIIRTEHPGLEGWENFAGVSHYADLPYALEIIRAKLISRHYIDILTSGLKLKRPVDWPRILLIRVTFESLRRDIKTYIKGLLRLLLVKSPGQSHVAASSCSRRRLVNRRMYPSVWSRNCLFPTIGKATTMHFSSPRSTHEASILHHKAVKVTIDAPNFAEVIFDAVICHHGIPGSVITDSRSLFSPWNLSLLCYFPDVRRNYSTAFYLQTSGPTKKPNSSQQSIY